MRLVLNAFLAVSAVAFTAVCIPLATPVSAMSCDDIKIIFARGSGQTLGDKEYQYLKTELNSALAPRNDISYSFYELGSITQDGHQYPAVGLDFFNIISAAVSAGTAASYGDSAKEGSLELTTYISSISTSCPKTKFVLAGYSQGAQVITTSASKIDPSRIIYAATFGDPKLYLPEGEGIDPPACHGQNLSDYRAYAPNCKTARGSLGAKNPYVESGWSGKLGLYCNDQDLVCGAGLNLSAKDVSETSNFLENIKANAMSGHTGYIAEGTIKKAVKTITDKISVTFPPKKVTSTPTASINSLILLDYSYLNEGFYPNLAEALYKVREIYHNSDTSSLAFYNNSNFDYENYYYLNTVPPTSSVDSFWHGKLRWDVATENTLAKRLKYALEHPHWNTVYILASTLSNTDKTNISPMQEKYGITIKVIYLEAEGFKAASTKTKTREKSNFNPFSLFSNSAYAESVKVDTEDTVATLISINDAPLGITTEKEINITDTKPGDKVILTTIKKDGSIGEQKEIIISELGYGGMDSIDNMGAAIHINTITTAMAATTSPAIPLAPNCGSR